MEKYINNLCSKYVCDTMVMGNATVVKSGGGYIIHISKNVVDALGIKEGWVVEYDMKALFERGVTPRIKKSAPQQKAAEPLHTNASQETQPGNPISPRPERQDYADPEDRDNEEV